VQFYYLTWICGGYHFARIIHFALTLGYVFFFPYPRFPGYFGWVE